MWMAGQIARRYYASRSSPHQRSAAANVRDTTRQERLEPAPIDTSKIPQQKRLRACVSRESDGDKVCLFIFMTKWYVACLLFFLIFEIINHSLVTSSSHQSEILYAIVLLHKSGRLHSSSCVCNLNKETCSLVRRRPSQGHHVCFK